MSNSQEFFIRFASTSSYASSSEQFVALQQDFAENHWHEAFDCELVEEILFQLIPHYLPADNPQQSETASHVGGNGNMFCRRDLAGGTNEHKESSCGYEALYSPGEARKPDQTIQCITEQLQYACLGDGEAVKTASRKSGVKDKLAQFWIEKLLSKSEKSMYERTTCPETRDVRLNERSVRNDERRRIKEELRCEIAEELWVWLLLQPADSTTGLPSNDPSRHNLRPGDHFNILLGTRVLLLGVNPHTDTPVEILHTVSLGNRKYVWHVTNDPWSKEQEEQFSVRLQSSDINGLTIPPIRAAYLVKYKNSLIGKHFKVLQQVGIFHLKDLCPPAVFELWKASGELGALLWFTEIHDMKTYLEDLWLLINNLLDAWAVLDPRRILNKIKLHILTHIPEDVRQFGLALTFATEAFKCFNAVFRYCSILSNHLSPSRDIASTMSDMERFKHMVSGGFWKDEATGKYIQGGEKIPNFLKANREVQRRLGWVDETVLQPGSVKLHPSRKATQESWAKMASSLGIQAAAPSPRFALQLDGNWETCKFVVSRSKDVCREGSWVFYKFSESETYAGRIKAILTQSPASVCRRQENLELGVVVLERYNVPGERDPNFNMPRLRKTLDIHIVCSEDILFVFNAQHNCYAYASNACPIQNSTKPVIQERMETLLRQKEVMHRNDGFFLINTHALHNAHLIRLTLPRELTTPIPFIKNRAEFHLRKAAELQISGPLKRAETQAKSKATRERNKKAREAAKNATQASSKRAAIDEVEGETSTDGERDNQI